MVAGILILDASSCPIPAHTHQATEKLHAPQITHMHEHLAEIISHTTEIIVFVVVQRSVILLPGTLLCKDALFPPSKPPPKLLMHG
jgi:hypothetical protein